jgi:IS1 family transposase
MSSPSPVSRVMAFHVGDRSRTSVKRLSAKIPRVYRQRTTFYTNQYVVYIEGIPAAQHWAISRLAHKTGHRERCNPTLRQRFTRLLCEALSFSKTRTNQIGVMQLFICHDKLTSAAAESGHGLDSTTTTTRPPSPPQMVPCGCSPGELASSSLGQTICHK